MEELQSQGARAGTISLRKVRARTLLVLAGLALFYGMDRVYQTVAVAYGDTGYPGYPYAHRGLAFRALCWTIGLAPALWMPMVVRRPSQVLAWCVCLMVVMPTAVVGVYATQPTSEIITMLLGFVGGLLILNASRLLPRVRIPEFRFDTRLFWLVIIGMSVAAYLITLRTFGATIKLVTLQEVYLQREAAQEVNAGAAARYLMSWQGLVINPLIMALGVAKRRPLLVVLGVAGQVFLFAVAAQRILLATPAMVLGFHFFLRRGGRGFGVRATVASAIAFGFSIVGLYGGGVWQSISLLLYDALLSRLFLNSGFLSVLYFKFFQHHPYVRFAEVKPFSLFMTSPYLDHYPVALALDVWGVYSDPNTNLFADGFAQLGYAGLAIEAVGLSVMFWLLDSVARSRRISPWLVAMICAGQVSSVVNASTSNIILGDGFGLLLLVLAIMPRAEVGTTWSPRVRRSHSAIAPTPLAA